jgi:hypothetical protein
LVAHLLWEQRVAGSNPVIPTIYPETPLENISPVDTDYILHRDVTLPVGVSGDMGKTVNLRKTSAKNAHLLPADPLPLALDKASYSVQETALLLGISTDSVTRYCQKGKLFAHVVQYGRKTTFSIPRQAVQIFLQEQAQQKVMAEARSNVRKLPERTLEHDAYLARFKKALETGMMNGKVYSPRTVADYFHYLTLYFSSHKTVQADGLETELGEINPE